jgi:hypothetical protein
MLQQSLQQLLQQMQPQMLLPKPPQKKRALSRKQAQKIARGVHMGQCCTTEGTIATT